MHTAAPLLGNCLVNYLFCVTTVYTVVRQMALMIASCQVNLSAMALNTHNILANAHYQSSSEHSLMV